MRISGGRECACRNTRVLKGRPRGVKLTKEDQRQGKIREGLLLAHAEATKNMVVTHMWKAALLEDHNLLMRMSMPDADEDADEYLRLRRQMELRKLRKLVAEEEGRKAEANAVNLPHAAICPDAGVSSPGAWSPGVEGYGQDEEQVCEQQEQLDTHTVCSENSQGLGSLHFSHREFGQTPANWFSLEHVDIEQPTQCEILGEQSERSNSQPIDLDGYQENLVSSENNVHFGLSFHGHNH